MSMFKSFLQRLKRGKSLKEENTTIISNNCVGGVVSHDYSLPFNSPFVNINISMEHFTYICRDLRGYMQEGLREVDVTPMVQSYFTETLGGGKITFPVGRLAPPSLDPVLIFFQHYTTFDEASGAWERRKKRMNYDHLFFIVAASAGQNEEWFRLFAEMPELAGEEKLCLTIDKPLELPVHTRCMHVPEDKHFLERKKRSLRGYYECFPYIRWFRGDKIP